jgi:hypothetical protein
MGPENDIAGYTRRSTQQNGCRYMPIRCSICTSFIWFRPIVLKEPLGAPEPLQQWTLCKPCHIALLGEMRRSSIRSPSRLRISIGLVAAERSPTSYHLSRERALQREFAWLMWLLTLFALLHLVILLILLVIPK